jgi:hypothetical protein
VIKDRKDLLDQLALKVSKDHKALREQMVSLAQQALMVNKAQLDRLVRKVK